METFLALLALCAGNRPVTPSFDIFFDLHLNWLCFFMILKKLENNGAVPI